MTTFVDNHICESLWYIRMTAILASDLIIEGSITKSHHLVSSHISLLKVHLDSLLLLPKDDNSFVKSTASRTLSWIFWLSNSATDSNGVISDNKLASVVRWFMEMIEIDALYVAVVASIYNLSSKYVEVEEEPPNDVFVNSCCKHKRNYGGYSLVFLPCIPGIIQTLLHPARPSTGDDLRLRCVAYNTL